MMKFLLIIVSFISISVSIYAQDIRNDIEQQFQTISNLNIREKPDINSTILKVLSKGDIIIVDSISHDWCRVKYDGVRKGYINAEYIEKIEDSHYSFFDGRVQSLKNKNIIWIILSILFIAYIIALVKSKNNTIIAIAGWKDLILLLVPIIGLVIVSLIFILVKDIPKEDAQSFLFIYILLSSISLLCSFSLSIIKNRKNIFNVIISILSKIFILLLLVLIVFAVFTPPEAKKNGRFKDGTRGNKKLKWYLVISVITSFLIFTLVKNNEEQKMIY